MKRYIIIMLICGSCLSCDTLLSPTPQGQIELDDLLTTESGIITAVNGAYQPLQDIYKGNMFSMLELAGDDGWIWRKEVEPDIFIIQESYGGIQSIWSDHYVGITRANTVLNRIGSVEVFSSEAQKNNLIGQVKFLRALYYFNLVRLFAGVPLILEEIVTRDDAEQPRASVEQVYAQIKLDLAEAITLLPASQTGGIGSQVGMANNQSARGLLVLVNLELQEWDQLIANSASLVAKGALLPVYANNFNGTQENGQNIFFEVQYGGVAANTTSGISNTLAPPDYAGLASVMPTDEDLNGKGGSLSSGNGFMQVFETGDNRKSTIVQNYGLSNFIDPSKPKGSLYYVNKYYNTKDLRGLSTWNFPLIRYAEMILARAEALNEKAYEADGEALQLLNRIRTTAGLPALTPVDLPDQNKFREALRKERRIELSFEMKRYFDLNRWGVLEEVIQKQMDFLGLSFPGQRLVNHPITGKPYFLYPIPAIEFVNNANLGEQNNGYN